jgi:hypothetical protein
MAASLNDLIDGTPFVGMTVTNVHTGYNVSIEWEDGRWSPQEFAGTASEAIRKCIRIHAPDPAPLLAPPPY